MSVRLTNCTVTTGYDYDTEDSFEEGEVVNYTRNTKRRDYIELEIPLPGGKAVYRIAVPNDFIKNIEYAEKLSNNNKGQ